MSLADSLKMHLRVVPIHGQTLRVVTLRPATKVRFSTNYFHDTWHILADADGAALFGQLLWGLAFQRQPGTLLLIDAPHVTTTPFEADAPDPIVVAPAGLTGVDVDTLRALRLRLRRAPMDPTTIRWHTFGMAAVLADIDSWRHRGQDRAARRRLDSREFMSRRAGYLCFTTPPALLRDHAISISRMSRHGAGYHPIAEARPTERRGADGEFQVIGGFDTQVRAARSARAAIAPERRDRLADDDLRWDIYARAARDVVQLRAARRRW